MKFDTTTITLSTKTTKDGDAIDTVLTLTGCEVSDKVIADSLISGQSPRVRLQNGFRANGTPKTLKMTWEQFITPGRQPRVVVVETPDSIAEKAKNNPEFLKALLDKLGLEMPNEESGEQSE